MFLQLYSYTYIVHTSERFCEKLKTIKSVNVPFNKWYITFNKFTQSQYVLRNTDVSRNLCLEFGIKLSFFMCFTGNAGCFLLVIAGSSNWHGRGFWEVRFIGISSCGCGILTRGSFCLLCWPCNASVGKKLWLVASVFYHLDCCLCVPNCCWYVRIDVCI